MGQKSVSRSRRGHAMSLQLVLDNRIPGAKPIVVAIPEKNRWKPGRICLGITALKPSGLLK